jgi:hypothetical protein
MVKVLKWLLDITSRAVVLAIGAAVITINIFSGIFTL